MRTKKRRKLKSIFASEVSEEEEEEENKVDRSKMISHERNVSKERSFGRTYQAKTLMAAK